jgi:chromosome segregation ATPase
MSESCEVCEKKLELVTDDLDITNQLLEESKAESKEQKDAYTRNMDGQLRTIERLHGKLDADLRDIKERHAKCEDTKDKLTISITTLNSRIVSLELTNTKLDEEIKILRGRHEQCTEDLEEWSEREAMRQTEYEDSENDQ